MDCTEYTLEGSGYETIFQAMIRSYYDVSEKVSQIGNHRAAPGSSNVIPLWGVAVWGLGYRLL